ncbi:MAG: DegV family protein, partial [Anaerolineaceae bacterium]|nr:DegV family protein [Anaerolineaceae bacterium]
MPIKIVVDSACDLPQGTREQYDITVTPNYINLGDRS